jgi:hypothetical protein
MKNLPPIVFASVVLGTPSFAAGPPTALEGGSSLDVGVHFSQLRNDFEYRSGEIPTRVEQISLSWREAFSPRVLLGLHGGYSFATQNDNPLTSGLELDGYHAGLAINVDLTPPSTSVRLLADATFTYQQVRHESSSQTVEIDWHETRLGAWALFPLGASFQIVAAARYGWTDGQQRASGVVDSSNDFEQRQAGAVGGFNLNDGQRGSVGILGYKGLDQGWEAYFKRQF